MDFLITYKFISTTSYLTNTNLKSILTRNYYVELFLRSVWNYKKTTYISVTVTYVFTKI